MKQRQIDAYMKAAEVFSQLSYAERLKVGAIIVKDNRIISIGYNGMPSGWTNECEDVELYEDGGQALKTKPEVLHAETNAIAKIARSTNSTDGADMFITYSPCLDCAKLIFQSGIRRVYFGKQYRTDDGVQFLKNSGIEVVQVD